MTETQYLLLATASFALAGFCLAKAAEVVDQDIPLNHTIEEIVRTLPKGRDSKYINAVYAHGKQTNN